MAETIVFSLPTPGAYEDPAYDMLWYQSVDGDIWNPVAVDTVLISSLPFSGGLYTWDSLLADANLYHKIKSQTQAGVESSSAILLPPRASVAVNDIDGVSLNNMNGVQTYTLGDTIELLFKTSAASAAKIGPTMSVDIMDPFDNIVGTVVAEQLGDLYVAEYVIPLNLQSRYNITRRSEAGFSIDFFYLRDVWNVAIGAKLEFNFQVLRALESPTEDNNVIQIFIDGVQGTDGSKLSKNMLAFTTLLNPFYTSVTSVKDTYRELLDSYDNFTVARSIINTSRVVDLHMKPLIIHKQDAFNLARTNFVKLKVAWTLLLSVIQVNMEKKTLDNFSIERTSAGPKQVLDQLEDEMRKYALFIWAGGKDTPFVSKTFEKGLFDPNRPNLGRANLDTTGFFPWVNSTSKSTVVMIDGNAVEVRGERTTNYPYVRSRITNSIDQGDVGYLSGI
jgi:hypothetical protein